MDNRVSARITRRLLPRVENVIYIENPEDLPAEEILFTEDNAILFSENDEILITGKEVL